MIMFGYKNTYENFENLYKSFFPYYELWASVNDFCLTTKAWNNQKMREMKHEDVEELIKRNERRVRRIMDKLSLSKAE